MLLRLFGFLLFLCATAFPVFAAAQMEKDKDVCDDYHHAEKQLSDTYGKILKEYSADKIFIHNLKASQKAWLDYREAHMKALYPHSEPGYYGSMLPMCECNKLAYFTYNRLKEIKQWLDGIDEGDVCIGSIKMNTRPVQ